MLQSIRERAQGWIAWVIVVLIAIPFALWGIDSYFQGGGKTVVASVAGQDIARSDFERQLQNTRMMLREQLGAAYDPALIDDGDLRREVLESMIRDLLLLERSHQMGLRASNDEIRIAIMTNPAFQVDGRFGKEAYERTLSIQGLSPAQFEARLRQRLVGSQLERAVRASELVTEAELDEALRLLGQEREVRFLRIEAAELGSDEPFSEAEIAAYYDAHGARFEVPEQVKLEYLLLDEEAIAAAAPPPSDAELRQRYEAEQARFGEPERRVVRHILVAIPGDAEDGEAQARQAAESARERILAGEPFEDVARAVSVDAESAANGGLIGEIQAGLMDASFDAAAFELPQGEVSAPVRTPFGYHLILVDEIKSASVEPFEEVRDQLVAEAAEQQIEALYYDWAERLATMTYEAADTLAPAAEALGLEIQSSDWVPRTGGEGLLGHPRVISAAFSDEVVREGLNSELIEPERGRFQAIVLRVTDHRDATVHPLADVREEIVAALREERAQRAAVARADELIARLEQGASLEDVAGDWPVSASRTVGRNAPGLPDEVRALAFDLPRPGDDGASYGRVALLDGDVAVVAVTQVIDGTGEDLGPAQRVQEADALGGLIARGYFDQMLADMAARAEIERNLGDAGSGADE
ncbi:SurA N-terminal domain-containing protein [Thiococcus pfennigii]|uniref:SurA N-terminal domain-containing protein n=1 Tax=Thiococcus pfennigii TaxID=1057 RepID=UPI0019076507|nr:SurA N-terminal domain-containing protein [Thiococcus pfennigii]MBK1699872.1 peptidylprolyl isomerase [Thiococcus pfennigii]MBK1732528.1 peptidylprolyl isomerase [Thiococcus pfennigii]